MKNFQFSGSTTQEQSDKLLKISNISDLLNNNLSIEKYTNAINSLFFIYQAFEADDKYCQYEETKRFRRKTKVMELYKNLDYNRLLQAKEPEVLPILAENYLKGIKELLQRKDFDNKRFYKDVEKLFIENGLIKPKVEA